MPWVTFTEEQLENAEEEARLLAWLVTRLQVLEQLGSTTNMVGPWVRAWIAKNKVYPAWLRPEDVGIHEHIAQARAFLAHVRERLDAFMNGECDDWVYELGLRGAVRADLRATLNLWYRHLLT